MSAEYVLQECPTCGALIADAARHIAWHRGWNGSLSGSAEGTDCAICAQEFNEEDVLVTLHRDCVLPNARYPDEGGGDASRSGSTPP